MKEIVVFGWVISRDIGLICAGAVIAMVIEHGRAWVWAGIKALWAKAKGWEQKHVTNVADVFKEVTSAVDAATAVIKDQVKSIEDRVTALEAKK